MSFAPNDITDGASKALLVYWTIIHSEIWLGIHDFVLMPKRGVLVFKVIFHWGGFSREIVYRTPSPKNPYKYSK